MKILTSLQNILPLFDTVFLDKLFTYSYINPWLFLYCNKMHIVLEHVICTSNPGLHRRKLNATNIYKTMQFSLSYHLLYEIFFTTQMTAYLKYRTEILKLMHYIFANSIIYRIHKSYVKYVIITFSYKTIICLWNVIYLIYAMQVFVKIVNFKNILSMIIQNLKYR